MFRLTTTAIAVGGLLLAGLGPITTAQAAGPGLSGTISADGHTLTWSTSGASAPTGDLVGTYDGVVTAGSTVTFSGSASFVIDQGYVTNLSQTASLTGATSASFSQRVGGGTYTTPFTLQTTAQASGTGSGVIGSLTARVSSRNCNDYGVCGGPSVSLNLAVISSGSAVAPPKGQKTLIAAAYKCLKQYLIAPKGHRFYKWTSRGSQDIYRTTLQSVQIDVNPSALRGTANAQYLDGVITVRSDPRTMSESECREFGYTLWEEVSHAIEDAHGDTGWFQSEDRKEARVDYMLEMNETWPILSRLETQARKGASPKALAKTWKLYTTKVRKAIRKAVRRGYTPDHAELKAWFGWDILPKKIKKNYRTGKFLPGPDGKQLRKALK